MEKTSSSHYQLTCPACGWCPEIDSYDIFCPVCGPEVLLKTCYSPHLFFDETISPSTFYHYSPVLPFSKKFSETGPSMACWHAKDLGELLGLNNLWVLFSGYAPNLDATFYSGTFKELEALGVFARVLEQTNKTLIVSSAGNAGRSFLQIGLKYQQPVIVVVPENALPELFAEPGHDPSNILLIALKNAYYPAAIQMVKHIKEKFSDFLVSESGCFNVARRDALGVPFWRAVNAIGHLPRHYVQAVGSGTGAIAAWEARSRLIASQIVPESPLCLHLVQNIPFTPMVDAWSTGNKKVKPMNDDEIGTKLSQTVAKVLSNANPPYSVKGGVYDVLQEACGHMYAVTNDEIHQNMSVIEKVIGVKPAPESAAALAGLKQALKIGNIESEDCVLLHLTGGGLELANQDIKAELLQPFKIIAPYDYEEAEMIIRDYLEKLAHKAETLL